MSHERKKGGERKDKKNERMRESVIERKAAAHAPKRTTDQGDIMTFKSGAEDDYTQQHFGDVER